MSTIRNMFSIYIVVVMLGIGGYMTFIQSKDLIQVARMPKEGKAIQVIGWVYIAASIAGFVIIAL
jgi:hypothetical protein